MGEGDGVLTEREEPEAADTFGSNREIGIVSKWHAPLKKVMWLLAQLKCLFSNACSVGNGSWKSLCSERIGIWSLSPKCGGTTGAVIDGCQDRQGRRGGWVGLCVNKWVDCKELSVKNSCERVESL